LDLLTLCVVALAKSREKMGKENNISRGIMKIQSAFSPSQIVENLMNQKNLRLNMLIAKIAQNILLSSPSRP
jgi:hypothetical protein